MGVHLLGSVRPLATTLSKPGGAFFRVRSSITISFVFPSATSLRNMMQVFLVGHTAVDRGRDAYSLHTPHTHVASYHKQLIFFVQKQSICHFQHAPQSGALCEGLSLKWPPQQQHWFHAKAACGCLSEYAWKSGLPTGPRDAELKSKFAISLPSVCHLSYLSLPVHFPNILQICLLHR